MTTEQRISSLEEAVVRIEGRLDGLQQATNELRREMNELRREMNSRVNLQMQINVAMWVTTMIGIIATLLAVVLGG